MDIGLLFLLSQALKPSPSKPDIWGTRSKNGACPPCPKPSSAIYQVPLREVSTFHDLGLLVPTQARDKQPVTPRPVTITIPQNLDLSGIDFTPTDTPSQIAERLKYGSGL